MAPAFKRPKLTNQQVGAAGEHFVAAEIHRRGGYAVTFSGNMHDIDLLASDTGHDRIISIQVKTKTSGTWQTSTTRGKKRKAPEIETKYWVLVDLGKEYPEFYVIPKWWMENDIHRAHSKYLAEFGGHRAKNDASTHHAIPVARVTEWKDRWDELGILPSA
jgi:Holliday junction resolvase-like predicted endonuclease